MTAAPMVAPDPAWETFGIVGRSLGIYDLFLGGDPTNSRLNQL